MHPYRSRLALTLVVGLFLTCSAWADIVITNSLTPPTDLTGENAVLLIDGETGTTVHGAISGTGAIAYFTTPQQLDVLKTVVPKIRAVDGSINQLTITAPGFTFTDLLLDIYGVYDGHSNLMITVNANDGAFTATLALLAGQSDHNYVSIFAHNGETITSVMLGYPQAGKFYAIQDIYFSGVQPLTNGVPEPSTLALGITGLAGLGGVWRRLVI